VIRNSLNRDSSSGFADVTIQRFTTHTSGLVFGSPMTFWPSFHWPRFLRSSTRSKRFSTLRLAAMVLAPFKLRCWDMIGLKG
jgi:hypothetical protein